MQKKKTYVIVDFEATCCNMSTIPRGEMEIIEIGAVAVDSLEFNIISEYQSFVQPVQNIILTDFCTELTTIQQKDVDNALLFPVVIRQFITWLQAIENPIFCSWGNYDKGQLRQDCSYHKAQYPFSDEHINIKNEFSKQQRFKKRYGMKAALKKANVPLEGRHHRGIDDARNMVKLMPYIMGNKKLERKY